MSPEGSFVGHSQLFHQPDGFDRINGFGGDFMQIQILKSVVDQSLACFVSIAQAPIGLVIDPADFIDALFIRRGKLGEQGVANDLTGIC